MGKQVHWGILGNATIAKKCMLPAIRKASNGVLHALGTRNPEEASVVAAHNHIQNLYGSYEAVLDDEAVDAVYIPLPNHLHYEWTIKALQAGKHVLCEKPLAVNKQQAQDMAAAASAGRLLLMEAFMYRFHPRSRRIKQIIDAGDLGTPYLARSSFCFPMDQEVLATGSNARLKSDMGGGALLDVGSYCISVARWLLDAEPTRVQAQAVYHTGGVDIHLVGTLFFPGDSLAVIEASFITTLQQTYSVVGSSAAIELPHNAFIPWENDAVYFLRQAEDETGERHVIPGIDEYQLMVEHFGDAVLGNERLEYSMDDSIRNMTTLDAMAQAARTGKTVELS